MHIFGNHSRAIIFFTMGARLHVTLVSRVVFLGETPEPDSAICFDTSDLRRYATSEDANGQ